MSAPIYSSLTPSGNINSQFNSNSIEPKVLKSSALIDVSLINRFGKVGEVLFANFSGHDIQLTKEVGTGFYDGDIYYLNINNRKHAIRSLYTPRKIIVEDAGNHLGELRVLTDPENGAWLLNPEKGGLEQTSSVLSPHLTRLMTINEAPVLNMTQQAKISFHWQQLMHHFSSYTLTINDRKVQLPMSWHDSSYRVLIQDANEPDTYKISTFNQKNSELIHNIYVYDAQQESYIKL